MSYRWARIAGAAIAALLAFPFAGAAPPAPSAELAYPKPNPAHVAVLDAAVARMHAHYDKFHSARLGPTDVFDYGVDRLWHAGLDGAGTTVAVIEGWDDPEVAKAVHAFDRELGLPDPRIDTVYPTGKLPARCPEGMVALGSYGSCEAWHFELELDVLSAHLMAPYANILISATPADSEIADDRAAQVAPPEMMRAVSYLAEHHLADVISISDGTGESTYDYGRAEITAQDVSLLTAAAAGVPVVVSTGDCGVLQNLAVASSQCGSTTTTPDTSSWDDSPWATAVGGSMPNIARTGGRLGPDPVWPAEGAGFSSVYRRPSYQDGVRDITGSTMRAVPDITMDSRDGTSEAAPLFAGVLALAAQLNGGPTGPVNQALYRMGPYGAGLGIADVVRGDDSAVAGDGGAPVPGFAAGPGFDVASGWGTVDASRFVPELVRALRADPNPQQRQAATALAALQGNLRVSSTSGLTYLFASGFLPLHPVRLVVDNRAAATITATPLGQVTYSTHLAKGRHTVSLAGMLLTLTTTVDS